MGMDGAILSWSLVSMHSGAALLICFPARFRRPRTTGFLWGRNWRVSELEAVSQRTRGVLEAFKLKPVSELQLDEDATPASARATGPCSACQSLMILYTSRSQPGGPIWAWNTGCLCSRRHLQRFLIMFQRVPWCLTTRWRKPGCPAHPD